MNVTVKDISFLQAMQPQQVAAYLQTHGWHQQNQIPDRSSIWIQDREAGEPVQIVLPLQRETPGFPVSMSVILSTLEKTEKRSQLDIISDLITTAANITIQGIVIQIQTPNADQLSGKITLLGVVIDLLRKIQTSLADHDYILAIKAYQERQPVVCTGDLIKENNLFIFKNPRHFAIDVGID
jgi:hypothetical protein